MHEFKPRPGEYECGNCGTICELNNDLEIIDETPTSTFWGIMIISSIVSLIGLLGIVINALIVDDIVNLAAIPVAIGLCLMSYFFRFAGGMTLGKLTSAALASVCCAAMLLIFFIIQVTEVN
jgi:hypothetical protein